LISSTTKSLRSSKKGDRCGAGEFPDGVLVYEERKRLDMSFQESHGFAGAQP
jgi:hypothetical protein